MKFGEGSSIPLAPTCNVPYLTDELKAVLHEKLLIEAKNREFNKQKEDELKEVY